VRAEGQRALDGLRGEFEALTRELTAPDAGPAGSWSAASSGPPHGARRRQGSGKVSARGGAGGGCERRRASSLHAARPHTCAQLHCHVLLGRACKSAV